MEYKKLFFNYDFLTSDRKKVKFKISIESIFTVIAFLSEQGKIKKLPDDTMSEIKENYDLEKIKDSFQIEEIDTFDYKNENKRQQEFKKQEAAYEKYIRKQY